jgi:4'-phosphopantetheinyl transferase EntD
MVADALAALAPPGVRTGTRAITATDVDRLHPVERAAVERAVDVRRHEFATGRVLLRSLLGLDVPIPVGPSRAPVLPGGFVGSLAHDRAMAVAAVTRDPAIAALGIDVEGDAPLDAGMARIILRPDEAGLDAHLAFCLKEAAYKAWSTLGGRMLDHHDVRLDLADDAFSADLDGRTSVRGRFIKVGARWLALVVIPERVAP